MSQALPVPEDVGRLYDRFTASRDATSGVNMHFGYWDTPDSDVPLSDAADRLTDLVTDRLRVAQGSHVLDVGCGVGGPAVRIAGRTGARVTGISNSQEQISRANAFAASVDGVEFRHADATRMPFPPRSFDAAVAMESIFHMPDRAVVLDQICQALRPGGRLVLTDFVERAPIPVDKQPVVDRYLREFMMTLVRVDDYPPMLRLAGLRLVEILDISEHTMRQTFSQFSEQGEFGHSAMADIAEFGAVLVVAQKP
ncbi:SAM-dependent methyltransferase [Actinosynnema sp. ALI-1.44]|uniref:SAM-dependent methyltransferase n=1 Tax=Actinosynnema sp. ALI-1.44 TaxID=1933779 RepID=UPI00097C9427|nr:methyltransferase domain-containing protein [Actinosynnema sp. ALI-1.44]ONI71025.1 SAM-dependent methyltransferase [Actinosynnema sp. ALI-1.44]